MWLFADGPDSALRINYPTNDRMSDILFLATPRAAMVDNVVRLRPTA
jgi:hypothetical protein